MGKKPRVVVVITEGAPLGVLRDFVDEGRLPGFRALFGLAAWGELASHVVPYEPPGLMTAFTGVSSSEHRWYSYWTVHEGDHRPRILTSRDLHVKPFWMRSEYADTHFSIVNVLGTHPPVPIPGELVSYPMGQTVRASHPPDLLGSLLKRHLPYTHDVSIWYKGQSKSAFVSRAVDADRRRVALAKHFYEAGSDAIIVNLTSIDRTCHYYWQELEPGSPVPRPESAILSAFECADELIRSLLNTLDEQTTLLVFSEIGFGPLRHYISVNEFLAKAGLLVWRNPGTEVDWAQTFAAEAVQGSSGININLAGRYHDGTVPKQDYERVRSESAAVLRDAINLYTGRNLFSAVVPREDVYEGAGVEDAPDLILFPEDHRYLPLGDPTWALHVNRPLQSGWHRDQSYWAVAGPAASPGKRLATASLLEILPTIEHALGRECQNGHQPLFVESPVSV